MDTDFSRTPLLPVPLREDLGAVFDSAALSILSILNIYKRVVAVENWQSSSNLFSHSICANMQKNDKWLSCHCGSKVMPLPGSGGLVGNFNSHFGIQMFMENLGHLWNSPNSPDRWLCTLAEHGDPMENYFYYILMCASPCTLWIPHIKPRPSNLEASIFICSLI